MNILSLLILAFLGESLWETLKMTFDKGKLSYDRIGALAIGILLSLSTGADITSLSGVPLKIPYLGMILTGILISRGANFVHDILKSINNLQENTRK